MLCLAAVRIAVVAGLLLYLIGVGWSIWSSQAMTQVQLAAPDMLRGRVISLYTYTLLATAPFGALAGGWLASIGGTSLAFGVAGGSGLAVVLFSALQIRRARAPATAAEVPL
jgi:hypothetical protein